MCAERFLDIIKPISIYDEFLASLLISIVYSWILYDNYIFVK